MGKEGKEAELKINENAWPPDLKEPLIAEQKTAHTIHVCTAALPRTPNLRSEDPFLVPRIQTKGHRPCVWGMGRFLTPEDLVEAYLRRSGLIKAAHVLLQSQSAVRLSSPLQSRSFG